MFAPPSLCHPPLRQVDLVNEPHAASWGFGRPSDFNLAAQRLGNHILANCPRWLIFIEGVGYNPGAPGASSSEMGIWWGGNLVGVHGAPMQLDDMSKLVYSPHVYGPSVYVQHYFYDADFPRNMAGVWDAHWGFVQAQTGQPIVIGEMGGFYSGLDKQWQDWALLHIRERHFGVFYFALNPTSEDTGGVLQDDWTTENAPKLQALAQLPSTSVRHALVA
eukprot:4012666-Prymnesium_polylepis.2